MASQRQLGIEQQFGREQAQVLESGCLVLGPVGVGDLAQRVAVPVGECLGEHWLGARGVAGFERRRPSPS